MNNITFYYFITFYFIHFIMKVQYVILHTTWVILDTHVSFLTVNLFVTDYEGRVGTPELTSRVQTELPSSTILTGWTRGTNWK